MIVSTTISQKTLCAPPLHNIGRTIKMDNHPIAVIFKENDMEEEKKKVELPAELQGKKFRIRKLTPRECFRLMGVDDKDIDKLMTAREADDGAKQMQNEHTSVKRVLSNSSLYKLAGNSIVVDVLFHLFRKMFIETGPDVERGEAKQLELF